MFIKKKVLAICDKLSCLKGYWHADSTISILYAAFCDGCDCYISSIGNISLVNGELFFFVRKIEFKQDPEIDISYELGELIKLKSEDFSVTLMRKEPPFDINYVNALSLLYFHKGKVFNDPNGIMNFQEKLLPLHIKHHCVETIISSQYQECLEFASQFKKVVLKPLNSFQSRDVFAMNHKDENFYSTFYSLTANQTCPIIVQRFIDYIYKGDLRVIMLGGEIYSQYSRVPRDGSFLSGNALFGSPCIKAEIDQKSKKICEDLSELLIKNGLNFVALDIVDGMLLEVNSTCPTGLFAIKQLYGGNPAKDVWRFFRDI